ncbi:hypothetical protein HMPREF1990_00477, partial [Porphyromonas gingivalis W4087]
SVCTAKIRVKNPIVQMFFGKKFSTTKGALRFIYKTASVFLIQRLRSTLPAFVRGAEIRLFGVVRMIYI